MYGPPPDCKRFEVERSNSLRKCIRPLSENRSPGHSIMIDARIGPRIINTRFSGTPLDCSLRRRFNAKRRHRRTAHGFSSHWSTHGQRRPPFGRRLAQPAVGNRIVWDHDSRRRLDCWILERSKVGELPSFSVVGSNSPGRFEHAGPTVGLSGGQGFLNNPQTCLAIP
jgi:hypothetical protein